MTKLFLRIFASIVAISFFSLLFFLTRDHTFTILQPVGTVGIVERDLLVRALLLMCIVVVPVILLAIFIGWHYREGNTKAKYTPNWEHSKMEELIWWSIPLEIVLVLGALTWTSTHALNPELPIVANTPPVTIEVVALPWKWLFIYHEEGVASVNELAIPVGRPVTFHITAQAPMNSFWIPALSGQMYAMTGMKTVLNVLTHTAGTYEGRSANYSGDGFAQMTFTVHALNQTSYDAWIQTARASGTILTPESYAVLARPSDRGPVQYFSAVTVPFEDIVTNGMTDMQAEHGHQMTLPQSSVTVVASTSTTTHP